jgi:type IV pilus assembly protein PilB
MAVVEAMTVTDEIRKLIIARSSAMEISKVAISQGMRTLRTVALDKVSEGITTLEQVLVVTSNH